MEKIITEVSPLSAKDCFYIVDREKDSFTYPLHRHEEMELNFVRNCDGARRIVGDSIEVLGKYDLALVGGGLEHAWDQYDCRSKSIHEITIQFPTDLLSEQFLAKNQLTSMRVMFENETLRPPSPVSTAYWACLRFSMNYRFRRTIICWPASRLPA